MTVYIDVLIIINLYINYFILRACTLVLRRVCSKKRSVLAALAGALGSLVILLPELPFPAVIGCKIAVALLVVFIGFGRQAPADFLTSLLFFLIVSFCFAGIMEALWKFAAPFGPIEMIFSNGTAYFNIPLIALAAFTAAGYFAIRLVRLLSDKRLHCTEICSVEISSGKAKVTLRGLCDTGCGLCDLFTGKPVVVCFYETAQPVIPAEITEYFNGTASEGLRLTPCRTAASESLIPLFKADIKINGKPADCFVGITRKPLGKDIDCVFNPKIISI